MTDGERVMLKEAHDGIVELRDALLGIPPGSPEGTKPLLAELRVVVQAYKRASWVTRAMVWALPTAALVGASVQSIWGWFGK